MCQSNFSPTLRCLCVLCVFGGSFSSESRASEVCNHWLPGPLHSQSEGIATAGIITASAIWSPSTGGTFLVVGGSFLSAGGAPMNRIAAWDGASWRPLGSGVNGFVHALAVFNGDLIVGGQFTDAGGVPVKNVARFDGTSWHAMGQGFVETGSTNIEACFALTVFENELIAGGSFDHSGGTFVLNIARWNGTSWQPIGGGVGVPTQGDLVAAFRVHNGELYIGGAFAVAGGNFNINNIARFAGGSYSGLNSGTLGSVGALQSFGADLIVGGALIQAGGIPANHVARWTPGAGTSGTWSTMSSGIGAGSESVTELQPFNGQLVAGGTFPGSVRAWNGSSWVGVGGGTAGNFDDAHTLNVFEGQLIVGGIFLTAGGVQATNIAQWSGSAWSALQAPAPQVLAMEQLGSRFVAAGSFVQSTTNQTPAHNIIGWNGSTLTRVQNGICCGEGTNGTIRALKSSSGFGINELVAGGDFTVAGGVTANRIAEYSDALFTGGWSAMGNGFNANVLALERLPATQFLSEAIIAGGEFTASGSGSPTFNRIAIWSGSPPSWFAMGTGFNGAVRAIRGIMSGPISGTVIAGGDFTTASGVAANRIARWPILNQNGWVPMGSGFNAPVHAIELHNGSWYAAGEFTASGATPIGHVARWTGTTWESVGGGTNGVVTALKSDGTNIYALGGFTVAGGVAVNRIARWNSTEGWSDVEGGTNDEVNALGFYRSEVQVGLGISLSDGKGGGEEAAPQPGKGWVRYNPTGIVWIAGNPIGQTVNCFNTATFTAQPAQGYSLLLATWHKNGVPLSDGPTGHGSTISGAHASTLTISSARTFDAGSYTCSFTNLCGSATSSAATLTVNSCCDSDFNNDTDTDVSDLLTCIGQWGPCQPPPALCTADIAPIGGNNTVNIQDVLRVISGWGACP